ncbi:high mobility group nucleosome-binding domain-containing protein 5-like [Embiotoca jacksoni]|uniref:high mobility group nucleosome-binding domain-containing protein 5-like n=1 Tax=Embiotoca jacksoni TaxID=100190 RepID=UPI003703B2DF
MSSRENGGQFYNNTLNSPESSISRKKKHAHTQETEEESTCGGFLPAASDSNVQCQDAEQIRKRKEEDEGKSINQEYNAERNFCDNLEHADATKEEGDEGNIHDVRRNEAGDELVKKKELLSEERAKDHENTGQHEVRQTTADINHDFKPGVGDGPAGPGDLNKLEETSMDGRQDEDEQTEAEQSEKTEKSSTKLLHADNERSNDVRQINDQEGKENTRKEYDLKPAGVEKERDVSGVIGDGKQNIAKDDQICHQGGRDSLCTGQGEEEEEEEVEEEEEEEKEEEEKEEKAKEEEEEEDSGVKGGKDQDIRRSRKNVSVTHAAHKDLIVEKQTKETGNEGDTEQMKIRENFSFRQAGSEIGGRPTEKQGVLSDDKTRLKHSQLKTINECEEVTRGRFASSGFYVKIIDEQHEERNNVRIMIIGETSLSIETWRENKKKIMNLISAGKRTLVTLSEGVSRLNLNEPSSSEQRKQTTQRANEDGQEQNVMIQSNANKK